MTVEKIIEVLRKFDPGMEVNFMGEIESGRSSSFSTNMNVGSIDLSDDGDCVEFRVWGDEDGWS